MSDQLFLPNWLPPYGEILRLAMALLCAGLVGEGFARIARLPRVSGYSLVGLLFGPSMLRWFVPADVGSLRIVVDLALALLLFELGVRVDLRWFRANIWIAVMSLAEAGLTFAAIFAALTFMEAAPSLAAAVAAIGVGTSPAVVMRIVAELRAEGQVTQRLLVLTALNVLYSVTLSKLISGGLLGSLRHGAGVAAIHTLYLLFGSLLMGAAIAFAFRLLRRVLDLADERAVAILFGLLLLGLALLQMLALPTMLAPLLAGILVKHFDRRPLMWARHFGTAGGVLVILLFVLTGMSLTLGEFTAGGLTALLLIGIRLVGKSSAVAAFGTASGLSHRQTLALALALTPMSGIAFLLIEDLRALNPEFGARTGAIVLSMVTILELLGPIGVQFALRLTNETNEPEH